MRRPRVRGLSVSIALHVVALALAIVLLWEPTTPPALFIDLTRPLEGSAVDGAGASPPAAVSAARRGPATRDRVRTSVTPAPAPMSEPVAVPAAPRPAEPAVAASPPAPTEVPVSPSPVLAPPAPPASSPPSAVASASPAPSAPVGDASGAAVDAAGGGSETVFTSTSIGSGTSAPAPSSAGTGTGRDTTAGDQRGPETTALAVPGDGGRAGGEYAAYLALVRRRIQESLRYPLAARRRGLTGSVHVEIMVEPSGRIAAVSLAASSSHPLLDEAALDAVRTLPRVPFPPDVVPRSLRVRLPVVFELR